MILSAIFYASPNAIAQKAMIKPDSSLHWMPKEKRDSILLAVSKAAILKYGPGYYKDTHRTVIEDLGVYYKLEHYEGLRLYKVTYQYDRRVERLFKDYAAEIYVRSDNGKAVNIGFGNGWGFGSLDAYETDEIEDNLIIPYEQDKGGTTTIRMPTIYYEDAPNGTTIYYILDENGNRIPTDEDGNEITYERGTKKNTP